MDFSSDSSSSQELPSNKSEQSNTSAIDAQVQAIENRNYGTFTRLWGHY